MRGKAEFSSDLNVDELGEAMSTTEKSSRQTAPAVTVSCLQPDLPAVSGPTTNSER